MNISNKLKYINVKNRTHYFFNDFMSIENVDVNNIKIDENPHKNILIYYIEYAMIKKDLSYLIFTNLNGYFEEFNGNKYLMLFPTNESKRKKNEELWHKTRDLIKDFITKNWDDQKHMKIKFNLYNNLPLNKIIEIATMEIVVRADFHENKKMLFTSFFRLTPA